MHGIPFDFGCDGATCVALALAVEGDVKSIDENEQPLTRTSMATSTIRGRAENETSIRSSPRQTNGRFHLDLGLYAARKRAGRQN